uniref:Uncharacterized protein n=1 Tax=Cacopsylla melanoneura TaxID=428564 RepID=A0A8D9BPT3_9HEMI
MFPISFLLYLPIPPHPLVILFWLLIPHFYPSPHPSFLPISSSSISFHLLVPHFFPSPHPPSLHSPFLPISVFPNLLFLDDVFSRERMSSKFSDVLIICTY